MFIFKSIILLCLIFTIYGENTTINCPRFCKCDSYLQLNRAQCSSKRLISAEVDLPNQVQILDLSYNDITTVDKKCFENFSHLKYLNLSNNGLHTIDWEAFIKLRRLNEIDLSYNRLEYLDERLFARNKYLLKINLEGNKLESLQHKTLLNNPFVEELNLKNSQLFLLQPELFSGLTNLKYLDLSKNLLNNFNVEDFQYLKKLQFLNLNENSIKCDAIIKNKLSLLEKRGINVTLDNCSREINGNFKRATEMFEKMVMATAPIEEEDTDLNKIHHWRSSIDLEEDSNEEDYDDSKETHQVVRKNNEWLRFAPDTILCNKQNFVLCQEYRSCLQDLNKAWHEQRIIKEQCPLHDIKFAFFMGIAIGVSAIVFILACALCMKRCFEMKKSVPPLDHIDDLPTQPLARPTAQLPPHVRRQPRRRAAPPPRSMVRYEGPVGENFLSRLFGRPARQQYYRSINQNTATLIRRLSRSNLFNNRLSQHFAERQTSSEPNSPAIEDDFSPSAPRPETPPPSYGDVVINNCSDAK